MTPTPRLRFVKRVVAINEAFGKDVRVLQQWWEDRNMRLAVMQYDKYGVPIPRYQGEWRDVPTEAE